MHQSTDSHRTEPLPPN